MSLRFLSGVNVDSNTLVVDSTNNRVGINTASPDYALDLGTSGTGNQIRARRIYANGTGTESGYTLDSTLIFQGASNSFNITNPGSYPSVAFTINSSGNVGIGTTSPGFKLDTRISRASGNFLSDGLVYAIGIQNTDTTAGNATAMAFGHGGYEYTNFIASVRTSIGANPTGDLAFGGRPSDNANFVERLRITSAGNVGIGTTAPAYKLEVSGSVGVGANSGQNIIYNSFNDVGALFQRVGSYGEVVRLGRWGVSNSVTIDYPTDGTFAISTNSSERMRITAGGNVGIGTTSPGTKLQVIGNIGVGAGTYNGGIYANSSSSGIDSNWGFDIARTDGVADYSVRLKYYPNTGDSRKGGIYNSLNDTWVLYGDSNNTPNVIIPSGNVGIGTTAPDALLNVGGGDGTPTATQFTAVVRGTSTRTMYFDGGGSSGASVWWGDGNTPQFAIDSVSGGGAAMWVHASSAWYRIIDVAANGNVGINQTAPRQKLDVFGNISLGSWTKPGSTYVGLRRDDDGSFGGGGDSGLVIESYNHAVPYNGDYSQKVHLRTHLYNGGSHNVLTAYGFYVGINTTSPSYNLQVAGTTAGFSAVGSGDNVRTGLAHYDTTAQAAGVGGQLVLGYKYIGDTDYTEGAIIKMYKEDGTSGNFGSGLRFQVRNNGANLSTKLVLDPSGNLGIGTTSPTSKLNVVGQTTFDDGIVATSSTVNGTGLSLINTDTGGNAWHLISTATGNGGGAGNLGFYNATQGEYRVYFAANGNVGVGTVSPGSRIEIAGTTGSYNSGIGFVPSGTGARNYRTYIATDGSFNFDDATAGATRINLSSTGNVGIGTTAPQVKLSVQGTQNNTIIPVNAVAKFVGGDAGIFVGNLAGTPNYGAWLQAMRESDGLVFPLHLQPNGGSVGIGTTSPGVTLDVNGSGIRITNATPNVYFNNTVVQWKAYMPTGLNHFAINDAIRDVLTLGYNGSASYFQGCNVGIGTTAPSARLQVVKGSSGNVASFTTGNTLINAYAGITLNATTQGADDWYGSEIRNINVQGSPNFLNPRLAFFVQNTNTYLPADRGEKMTILGDGNVGIGTTSPANKLEVDGGSSATTLRVSTTNTGVGVASLILANSSKTAFNDGVKISHGAGYTNVTDLAGTSVMVWDMSNARVGIGTTVPSTALEVAGTVTLKSSAEGGPHIYRDGGNAGDIRFFSTNGTFASPTAKVAEGLIGQIHFQGYTGSQYLTGAQIWGVVDGAVNSTTLPGRLEFRTGTGSPSIQMVIKSNGNVGIGTTAPDYALDVNRSSGAGARVRILGTTNYVLSQPQNNSGALYVGIDDSSGGGFSLGAYTRLIWSSGAYPLAFAAGDAERMRLTSGGNVLIGTTTDAGYKLRVNGEILADDDIRILNTYALVINGTDNNWRIGRNTITDTGWLTSNTMQMVVFGGSTGQGFQVVNSNGTALFEIDGVAGASRFSNALGVGVNPSGTSGRIDASNDIVAYSTSDSRLKENITPIANALDKVKSLTGVEFDWKEETKDVHGYEGHDVGVIAQEVQAVLPEAIRTNDSGYLSVRYEKMIALLIEANKELAARVEELEKKLK
jgi:hypothetical protein